VVIGGRVQGVGFRATCQWRAQDLGLAGWVRNRADGRVEAVFEGPPEAVEEMVAWCRVGPRAAAVAEVDISTEDPSGEEGFAVR
jgi:acylphosphatase